jgi:hypothetical protein
MVESTTVAVSAIRMPVPPAGSVTVAWATEAPFPSTRPDAPVAPAAPFTETFDTRPLVMIPALGVAASTTPMSWMETPRPLAMRAYTVFTSNTV